jgi:hypothetical protein
MDKSAPYRVMGQKHLPAACMPPVTPPPIPGMTPTDHGEMERGVVIQQKIQALNEHINKLLEL